MLRKRKLLRANDRRISVHCLCCWRLGRRYVVRINMLSTSVGTELVTGCNELRGDVNELADRMQRVVGGCNEFRGGRGGGWSGGRGEGQGGCRCQRLGGRGMSTSWKRGRQRLEEEGASVCAFRLESTFQVTSLQSEGAATSSVPTLLVIPRLSVPHRRPRRLLRKLSRRSV